MSRPNLLDQLKKSGIQPKLKIEKTGNSLIDKLQEQGLTPEETQKPLGASRYEPITYDPVVEKIKAQTFSGGVNEDEKSYLIELYKSGKYTPIQMDYAIHTVAGNIPEQQGDQIWYKDKTGFPRHVKYGQKAPEGYGAESIWGSKEAADDDNIFSTIGKNLANSVPQFIGAFEDIGAAGQTFVTGKEPEWYQAGKNRLMALEGRTSAASQEEILNTEGVKSYTDLLDPNRWNFTADNVAGGISQAASSILQFAGAAYLTGGLGGAAVAESTAAKLALKSKQLVAGLTINAGETIDMADKAGLKDREKFAFGLLVAAPVALVEMELGIGSRILRSSESTAIKSKIYKSALSKLERDAEGSLTSAGMKAAQKEVIEGSKELRQYWLVGAGKQILDNAIPEAGEEVLQGTIQAAGAQLYDKLFAQGKEVGKGKFGTEVLSPEEFGKRINEGIMGLLAGGLGGIKQTRREKEDAQSKSISQAIAEDVKNGNQVNVLGLKADIAKAEKSGNVTPEEAQFANLKITNYKAYHEAVQGTTLNDEEKRRISDLTWSNSNINNQITELENKKTTIAPEAHSLIDQQIEDKKGIITANKKEISGIIKPADAKSQSTKSTAEEKPEGAKAEKKPKADQTEGEAVKVAKVEPVVVGKKPTLTEDDVIVTPDEHNADRVTFETLKAIQYKIDGETPLTPAEQYFHDKNKETQRKVAERNAKLQSNKQTVDSTTKAEKTEPVSVSESNKKVVEVTPETYDKKDSEKHAELTSVLEKNKGKVEGKIAQGGVKTTQYGVMVGDQHYPFSSEAHTAMEASLGDVGKAVEVRTIKVGEIDATGKPWNPKGEVKDHKGKSYGDKIEVHLKEVKDAKGKVVKNPTPGQSFVGNVRVTDFGPSKEEVKKEEPKTESKKETPKDTAGTHTKRKIGVKLAETDEQFKERIEAQRKAIIDHIDKPADKNTMYLKVFPYQEKVGKAAAKAAVNIYFEAVLAGHSIAVAVKKAIEHIKENYRAKWNNLNAKQQKEIEDHFTSLLDEQDEKADKAFEEIANDESLTTLEKLNKTAKVSEDLIKETGEKLKMFYADGQRVETEKQKVRYIYEGAEGFENNEDIEKVLNKIWHDKAFAKFMKDPAKSIEKLLGSSNPEYKLIGEHLKDKSVGELVSLDHVFRNQRAMPSFYVYNGAIKSTNLDFEGEMASLAKERLSNITEGRYATLRKGWAEKRHELRKDFKAQYELDLKYVHALTGIDIEILRNFLNTPYYKGALNDARYKKFEAKYPNKEEWMLNNFYVVVVKDKSTKKEFENSFFSKIGSVANSLDQGTPAEQKLQYVTAKFKNVLYNMKSSHDMSSHIMDAARDITDKGVQESEFYKDNSYVQDHKDSPAEVIFHTGRYQSNGEKDAGKVDEAGLSENDLRDLVALEYKAGLKTGTYNQIIGQFGDKAKLAFTRVKLRTDIEQLKKNYFNKLVQKKYDLDYIDEQQEAIKNSQAKFKQYFSGEANQDKATELFAWNYAFNFNEVNEYYNGSDEQYNVKGSVIKDIFKRNGSAFSPGGSLNEDIEGGVGKGHRLMVVQLPDVTYVNPQGKKVTMKASDGQSLIRRSFSDKIQVSAGSAFNYNTMIKAITSFVNPDGSRFLDKTHSITIDELAEYNEEYAKLLKVMNDNNIDKITTVDGAKKLGGVEVWDMKSPITDKHILTVPNKHFRVQQDFNNSGRLKKDKVAIQQQKNEMISDWSDEIVKIYNDISNKQIKKYIDDLLLKSNEEITKEFLSEMVKKVNSEIAEGEEETNESITTDKKKIVQLLKAKTPFEHSYLRNWITKFLANKVTENALGRLTNRGIFADVAYVESKDFKLDEARAVDGKVLLPTVAIGIASGFRGPEKRGYIEKQTAIDRINADKVKYWDMFDSKGEILEHELLQLENGNWAIPGEIMKITRVPADDMHSHVVARVKYLLPKEASNIVITSHGVQDIAGADFDGDQRFVEGIFKNTEDELELKANKAFHLSTHMYYDAKMQDVIYTAIDKKTGIDDILGKLEKNEEYPKDSAETFVKMRTMYNIGLKVTGIMAIQQSVFDYMRKHDTTLNKDFKFPDLTIGKDGKTEYPATNTFKSVKGFDYALKVKAMIGNYLNLALDNGNEVKIGTLGLNEVTAGWYTPLLMMGYSGETVAAFFNHPAVKKIVQEVRNTSDVSNTDTKYDVFKKLAEQWGGNTKNKGSVELTAKDFEGSDSGNLNILKKIIELDNISNDMSKINTFIKAQEQAAQVGSDIYKQHDAFNKVTGRDFYKLNTLDTKSFTNSPYAITPRRAIDAMQKVFDRFNVMSTELAKVLITNRELEKGKKSKLTKNEFDILNKAVDKLILTASLEITEELPVLERRVAGTVTKGIANTASKYAPIFNILQVKDGKVELREDLKRDEVKRAELEPKAIELLEDMYYNTDPIISKIGKDLINYLAAKYSLASSTFGGAYSNIVSTKIHKEIGDKMKDTQETWNQDMRSEDVDAIDKKLKEFAGKQKIKKEEENDNYVNPDYVDPNPESAMEALRRKRAENDINSKFPQDDITSNKAIIDIIKENGTKEEAELVSLLQPFINETTEVEFVNELPRPGQFMYRKGKLAKIKIRNGIKNNVTIYIHELSHEATVRQIHQYGTDKSKLNEKQIEAIENLTKVYNFTKAKINKGQYGFNNLEEFVAEAFSNKEFQKELDGIEYRNSSILNKLLEGLQKLLGIKKDTALAEVFNESFKLAENTDNAIDLGKDQSTVNAQDDEIFSRKEFTRKKVRSFETWQDWADDSGFDVDGWTKEFNENLDISEDEKSSPEDVHNAMNELFRLEAIEKKMERDFEEYKAQSKQVQDYIDSQGDLSEKTAEELLTLKAAIRAYPDLIKDKYIPEIEAKILLAIEDIRNKEIQKDHPDFDPDNIERHDMTAGWFNNNVLMKALSDIGEAFPALQFLANLYARKMQEMVVEKETLVSAGNVLAQKVIDEYYTSKEKGGKGNSEADRAKKKIDIYHDNSIYFSNLMVQGGERDGYWKSRFDTSLSPAEKALLSWMIETKARYQTIFEQSGAVQDALLAPKIDPTFGEIASKHGMYQATISKAATTRALKDIKLEFKSLKEESYTDENGKRVVIPKGSISYKTLDQIQEILGPYGRNGSAYDKLIGEKEMLIYTKRAKEQLRKGYHGTYKGKRGELLETKTRGDFSLSQHGKLISKFSHNRAKSKPYSKDSYRAFMNFAEDMIFIKHMNEVLPVVEAIENATIAFGDANPSQAQPNLIKFLDLWKRGNLMKEVIDKNDKAAPVLRFLRTWTSWRFMAFAPKTAAFNFLTGKYNTWRDSNNFIAGEARIAKNKKKAFNVINKNHFITFESTTDLDKNIYQLFLKVGMSMNEAAENWIHGSAAIAAIPEEMYNWMDDEGKIILTEKEKEGLTVGEIKKRVKERTDVWNSKAEAIKTEISRVQGKYSVEERRNFQHYELGKSFGQFKIWMIDMYKSRFGERYMDSKNRIVEGTYTTMLTMFREDMLKELAKPDFWKSDSVEAKNMRKNVRGLVAIGGLVALSMAIGGDDDDDEQKNLHKLLSEVGAEWNLNTFRGFVNKAPMASLSAVDQLFKIVMEAFDSDRKGNLKLPKNVLEAMPFRAPVKMLMEK